MIWPSRFVLLVILAAFAVLSSAEYDSSTKRNTPDKIPYLGRAGLYNKIRRDSSRSKCGTTVGEAIQQPPSNPPVEERDVVPWRETQKRNLVPWPLSAEIDDLSLPRRALDEWPSDVSGQDLFMRDHVAAASIDVVPARVNGADINSGIYHEIGENTAAYSVGLGNTRYKTNGNPIRLTGCTLLAVMSQKAVWIGHFWENLSFGDQSNFKIRVLDMLDNGGTENPAVQASLKDHSDNFRNVPQSAAWIIYPVAEIVDDVFTDYTSFNRQLQQKVQDLTGITATLVKYDVSDKTNGALGRVLYEYDPKARDSSPQKGFRFIHEYTNEGISYFDDAPPPSPQPPPPSPQAQPGSAAGNPDTADAPSIDPSLNVEE